MNGFFSFITTYDERHKRAAHAFGEEACNAATIALGREMKYAAPVIACDLFLGGAAQARDSLGVFERWGAFRDAKIGRASCREGVCQYGEHAVGGVSLKKKK